MVIRKLILERVPVARFMGRNLARFQNACISFSFSGRGSLSIKGQRLGFTPCGRLFYVAYTLHCTGTVYEVVLMVKPREHARSLMEREKIGYVEVDAVCARHVGKYLV